MAVVTKKKCYFKNIPKIILFNLYSRQGAIHQHSMLVQTSFDSHRDSGKGALGPHITVINHDVDAAKASGGLLGPPGLSRGSSGGSSLVMGTPSPRQLSRQGSSMESTAIVPIHHHTVECSASGRGVHHPTTYSKVCYNSIRSIP